MSDSIDDRLMSSTSPAPENAAPTGKVRTEQGQQSSRDGDQNNSRSWTQTSLSNSTSLLTRALAANDEGRRILNGPPEASTTSSRQSVPPSNDPANNGVTLPDHVKSGSIEMAEVVPVSAVNIAGTTSLGSTPIPSAVHLPNMTQVNNLFASHREILNGTRGRGTSLERTEKEKRVEDSPKGTYSTNPGDTALPPSPESLSPITLASNNPPTEGVRARYRLWRDVRPGAGSEKAWSIGDQGSDDSQGQVEKSIKEAMTGGELNNRSRKASHSLGFFKEGLPDDKSKKKDPKGRGHSKEETSRAKAVSDNGKQRLGQEAPIPESFDPEESDQSLQSPVPSPLERPMSKSALRKTSYGASPTSTLAAERGYFDTPHNIEVVFEEQAKSMPPQLLAEIRKHHNLTPGAAKGSSFSRSIPVTASERRQSPVGEQEPKPSGTVNDANEDDSNHDDADLSHIKSNEEEDESGEEQISSALFVPHHTPHEAPEEENHGLESVARPRLKDHRREPSNSQQWLEEHKVPPREVDKKYLGQEAKSGPLPTPLPSVVKQQAPHSTKEALTAVPEIVKTNQEALDDKCVKAVGEEPTFADALITTPTGLNDQIPSEYSQNFHDHQQDPKRPLEAIELIPYRHQVGGHTTMWRFSKRAVCKQLNNRENEFYERVERDHPLLLKFLPKYIGVLNVTFEKQIRRRSTRKEPADANTERQDIIQDATEGLSEPKGKDTSAVDGQISLNSTADQPRLISQSMQSSSSVPVPTVTFADNRHIIPRNFMQPNPHLIDAEHRSKSDGVATMARNSSLPATFTAPGDVKYRPTLSDKHAASWGATTVNKQLRNQVFGEAFLQQPIPIQRHKKPASQQRPLPSRHVGSGLRTSNSESSLTAARQGQKGSTSQQPEESIRRKAMKTAAERRNGLTPLTSIKPPPRQSANTDEEEAEFDEKAGTSAPEPEIARSPQGKRQRRYSSGGLRRKPAEVADPRGHLKYFEEADDAGYKGDIEDDVFPMDKDTSQTPMSPSPASDGPQAHLEALQDKTSKSTALALERGELSAVRPVASREPSSSLLDIPRPVNPKEAQTQRDSRVEYFLLLEDLTAGMKRPCIMDLKMGTRQYGVDANEKKQLSQQRKCAATTSKELGVRVCGLQVWDKNIEKYIFKDKYFGRDLKVGRQFQDALTRFLYDGVDYASVLRHIPTILAKLSKLEVLIRGLPGYRFYAASLLLFYDGETQEEGESDSTATEREVRHKNEIDFKIADFANCVTMEDFRFGEKLCPPRHPGLPDNGFLRGLASLKKYFMAIQREIYAKEMGKTPGLFKNGLDGTASGDSDANESGISY